MNRHVIGWVTALALAGCNDVISLDPLDDRPPVEAKVRPKPISGGTLMLTRDGLAVAADPDRDLVHVADLDSRRLRHTVALEAGDEPGRVVEGREGMAHVIARGFGGVLTLDLVGGKVSARHRVCPDPRGIAFDAEASTLHVACADGTLFEVDEATGQVLGRATLDPDLRDVVLVEGVVHVSRLRSATIETPDGLRLGPPGHHGKKPHVAWRTRVEHEGPILVLHQHHDPSPVPIDPDPGGVSGDSVPYGGGVGFCNPGIVDVAITTIEGDQVETMPIFGASLTVDAALSPDGKLVALAMPGAPEEESTLAILFVDAAACALAQINPPVDGQVTAVAYAPDGTLVAQSREPASLFVIPSGGSAAETIELEGESRFDTGHEIFHRDTKSGLSCATCHPEGTDDGFVWNFEQLGPRRTQALDIGLEGTEPFHWDGDMDDLGMIMDRVLAHRMGGKRQSRARQRSFERWMFLQERPPADATVDEAEQVRDGEAAFVRHGCGSCHHGPKLGGGTSERIGDLELQVPSLRRVSLRPPFMHDGRSQTLEDAVRDMIVTTTPTRDPTPEDVAAISAYLRTL